MSYEGDGMKRRRGGKMSNERGREMSYEGNRMGRGAMKEI